MKITFLGQGFETASVNALGYHLIACFKDSRFDSFIGLSAFASEAGIFGLSQYINDAKAHFKNITLIVGVDQEGTSEEALSEILNLDVNSYIFYQSEPPIFHPKIYLFEGDINVTLIIGSSNLTANGLFRNIESSLLIEFNTNSVEGKDLIAELKSYFKTLFNFSDPNLFKISLETIMDLINKGVVSNAATKRNIFNEDTLNKKAQLSIGQSIPKRTVVNIPSIFKRKHKKKVNTGIDDLESNENYNDDSATYAEENLVWISSPLSERDLNIPKGLNTNVTGSMLFSKGKYPEKDQRHYFREEVFAYLPWTSDTNPKTSHLERATAFFHIVIEDVDKGVYPLMITHNTRTDTKTYAQKNAMTSLSWAKAKSLIADARLLNLTLRLYNVIGADNEFVMVID